jgi:3-deoxy-D-manno-octulosonate 8-phosphate phosphatase (KDO 8-P phosphatase)
MDTNKISEIFENLGGSFLTPANKLAKKLENTQAIFLDWDGVFNSGEKGVEFPSSYNEIDSLGINLLRFALYRISNKVPFIGIITDQVNESAFQLAKREHFDAVYFTFKYTREAVQHVNEQFNIKPSQIMFVMDDVLDVSAADLVGTSFLVRRSASPLFEMYVRDNELIDYITANTGNRNAVREICELVMGLLGNYNEVIEARLKFDEAYKEYTEYRDKIESRFYHKIDRKIIETII